MKDFDDQLSAALAPAMAGVVDRLVAKEIVQAAQAGGVEAAKEVAKRMSPEQAARVARRLES